MQPPRFNAPVQTPLTAPPAARDLLIAAKERFGFVPNLFGVLANAPTLLEGYLTLQGIFDKSSLDPTERQVVLLATSVANECEYCVAAHTMIAGMQKVDSGVVGALRGDQPLANPRLEALRGFARDVVAHRGWPEPTSVDRFRNAGYTTAQALEVVLGVGLKTMSNYANHLAGTPLDGAFAPAAWSARSATACDDRCTH